MARALNARRKARSCLRCPEMQTSMKAAEARRRWVLAQRWKPGDKPRALPDVHFVRVIYPARMVDGFVVVGAFDHALILDVAIA